MSIVELTKLLSVVYWPNKPISVKVKFILFQSDVRLVMLKNYIKIYLENFLREI